MADAADGDEYEDVEAADDAAAAGEDEDEDDAKNKEQTELDAADKPTSDSHAELLSPRAEVHSIPASDATIHRPNDISSRYWSYRIVSISSRKISKFRYIVIVSISFQYRRNDVDVVYLFSFL